MTIFLILLALAGCAITAGLQLLCIALGYLSVWRDEGRHNAMTWHSHPFGSARMKAAPTSRNDKTEH